MGIKAIFWDNDGVLVETEHLYAQAIQQVFDRIGFKADAVELYKEETIKHGRGIFQVAQRVLGFSEEERNQMREERNKIYRSLVAEGVPLKNDVEEVLKQLKASGKYKMGIVTASYKQAFDIVHDKTGVTQYMDFVLTREDFERSKPYPECYLKAVEKVGFTPESCLAIEDSERGILAAKAAGIGCWSVLSDFTMGEGSDQADRSLENLTEILDILK